MTIMPTTPDSAGEGAEGGRCSDVLAGWRRWRRRHFPTTRETLEEFTAKFPGVCPICSLHRYGLREGHTSEPRPQAHYCPERSRSAARSVGCIAGLGANRGRRKQQSTNENPMAKLIIEVEGSEAEIEELAGHISDGGGEPGMLPYAFEE